MIISGGIQFDGIIDGTNAIRIDLSNQADMIACDANGKVRFARTIMTVARIYDGATPVTSGVTVGNVSLNVQRNGVSTDIATKGTYGSNGVTIDFAFQKGDVLSATFYALDITLTYNGVPYTATFPITRTDATAIYQLLPSLNEIAFGVDANNEWTPDSIDLSCTYTVDTGSGQQKGTTCYNFGGATKYYIYYTLYAGNVQAKDVNDPTKVKYYTGWGEGIPIATIQVSKNRQVCVGGTVGAPTYADATALEFVMSTASRASDISDSNIVDRETVPILKSGKKGANSIRLALDNEHEDFIYNDAGERVSSVVTSQVRLYDGLTARTYGTDFTATIDATQSSGVVTNNSSSPYYAYITDAGVLTVNGVSTDSAVVVVKCHYNNTDYFAKFTANRTIQDNYDLNLKPNAIAYNPATYTTQSIVISGTRTDIQGNKSTIGFGTGSTDISSASGSGVLRLFATYINSSGNSVIEQITSTPFSVTAGSGGIADRNTGIYFELRKYSGNSYTIADYETVEIAKAENGKGISSITKYFMANSSGTSAPKWNASTWKTDPSIVGWSASNRYLWCREQINYDKGNPSYSNIYLHSVWGKQGNTGHAGRWYEFKAEYPVDDSAPGHETISSTDDHGWYIKRGSYFHMLIAPSNTPVNTNTCPTDNRSDSNWEYMGGDRQYYISKAFFGEYAQFGSFIINGDWMISTKGTVSGNGGEINPQQTPYTYFDPLFVSGGKKEFVEDTIKVISASNQNVLFDGIKLIGGKKYIFSLVGKTEKSGTLSVVLKENGGSGRSFSFETISTSTYSTKTLQTLQPNSDGDFQITAKTNNVQKPGYINSISVKAVEFPTFTPNFAVDGLTGETYMNKAHVSGNIIARGLLAEDEQFTTEISPGITTWRSVAFPLAGVSIGVEEWEINQNEKEVGMFIRMTDKNGNLIWDISKKGSGKITGNTSFGQIYLKKVSSNAPEFGEFSYVTQADCTLYYTNSGKAYKQPNTASDKIAEGYYVGINNGQFKQNFQTGRYVVRLYQYGTVEGTTGSFIQTIDYEFDM